MYLLLVTKYCQATAIFPKTLFEYAKLFFLVSSKIFMFNVDFNEATRTISRFPFLNFILKKLSIFLRSCCSMSQIFGPRNETLLLPWYAGFSRGLENSEICLKLYRLLFFCLNIRFIIGVIGSC